MYVPPQRIWLRTLGYAILAVLCVSTTVRAQVAVGSETQLTLDGSVSAGYSGNMSNEGPDGHGLGYGGVGNLAGSYYSPQFLSFSVMPFFNQSRNNSNYQSITDSSGVTATANIFAGSKFPGTVNFSKIFNSESSNFVVPGLANYATNGNSQTFGVGWSANFKTLPSLSFGYQQGSNNYSIYGTRQENSSNFHSVYASALYFIDGFHLTGGIHYTTTGSTFSEIGSGGISEEANGTTQTYTLGMSRSIDLSGNTWLNFTRNTTNYDFLKQSDNQTSDILTGGFNLKPTAKLSAQISGDYYDNLSGYLAQQVTSTGALVPVSISGAPSHSWGVAGDAQYSVFLGLYVGGTISYRQQLFEGTSFDSTAYSGSVSFGHHLFGGQFSTSATAIHSSYANGNSMLGLLTNAIYIYKIGEWGLSGSFGYSRNVQTILISSTSSGYNYSASANRRIGRLHWNGGASGSRSTLDQNAGFSGHSQSYSTGLSGRWLSVNGSYAKAGGNGLLATTGVTPLPPGVPPTLVPTILYSGTTYSGSVGSTPVPGLTFTGSYVQSRSNTAGGAPGATGTTKQAYAYLNYRFRKVYFNAGYSRLLQGFSTNGQPPALLSTYYFGLSRWFKAF